MHSCIYATRETGGHRASSFKACEAWPGAAKGLRHRSISDGHLCWPPVISRLNIVQLGLVKSQTPTKRAIPPSENACKHSSKHSEPTENKGQEGVDKNGHGKGPNVILLLGRVVLSESQAQLHNHQKNNTSQQS